MPFKTPHFEEAKKRIATYLNGRLAITTIRMLACSLKPDIMKDFCNHFRCIGNFKSVDQHRYGPDNFIHIYVNVGSALRTIAVYAGIVSTDRVNSVLPVMAQSPLLDPISEKML